MIPDITIKRNDVGKVLSGQLLDANGLVVNCSGFTSAKLFWVSVETGEVKINGATFNIPSPATGSWNYACTSSDVNTSGLFKMELEVGFGATRLTFPTDSSNPYLIVLVQDDLG